MLTHDELKERMYYDSETGLFNRLKNNYGKTGHLHKSGYIKISFKRKMYYVHRLAWLYHYGVWPKNQIDHINGIKSDNRVCNLREATNTQNQYNTKKPKNNTSGYKGISWMKREKRWRVRINLDKKEICGGYFSDIEKAKEKLIKLHQEYIKEFSNRN